MKRQVMQPFRAPRKTNAAQQQTIDNLNQPAISSTVSSTNLSEFEAIMDRASAAAAVSKNKSKKAAGKSKANSKKDVLHRENQRLASEADGALVPVDFMMLDGTRDDNEVHIVSAQPGSLSLLVEMATQQVSSPQVRRKKATKVSQPYPNPNPNPNPLALIS